MFDVAFSFARTAHLLPVLFAFVVGVGCSSAPPSESDVGSVDEAVRPSGPPTVYRPTEIPGAVGSCFGDVAQRVKTPGVLNVAVAFGYSDETDEHSDDVTDGPTMASVRFRAQNQCLYAGQGYCGFALEPDTELGAVHLTRKLSVAEGQEWDINLYMINSSLTTSHRENRANAEAQAAKTERAKTFYTSALQNLDVVFYAGHSRNGGGPDFAPPRPAANGKVNYPWYEANRPGLKALLAALDGASSKPMELGLFSCASRGHFFGTLRKHAPDADLVLSRALVSGERADKALYATLESVMNFECPKFLPGRLTGTSFGVDPAKPAKQAPPAP